MSKTYIYFFIFASLICSCKNSDKITEVKSSDTEKAVEKTKIVKDTIISIPYNLKNQIFIKIICPKNNTKIIGNILMLHGWDCPSNEWCEKTDFCKTATDEGYILIIPELGKCNYMTQIYPETYPELAKYPTLNWIIDTMITGIQKNIGIFTENDNNYVAGLSTGGRGATLLAYRLPKLIKAVASISGEFNICTRPDYYLYKAYLGNYEKFTERWKNECFAYDCKNYLVPTYLAHGLADPVANSKNSSDLYNSVHYYHPEMNIKININDTAKHNYSFWNSETKNIINFFNEN